MMKRAILIIGAILCASMISYTQSKLEIRLVPTNSGNSAEILCFDTQFKNISEETIPLADQNYRLFYDSKRLELEDAKLKSFLPRSSYESLDINQTLHDIDARGYGDLKFSQNLGFINYSIKALDTDQTDNVITLPPNSPWMSTTNICFNTNDVLGPVNIVWARDGLTDGYATAYTEISQYQDEKQTSPVLIQIYHDFVKLSDGTGVNDPMVLQSTQNH